MKSKITILILFCINSIFAQYPVLSTSSLVVDPTNDINFSKKGNYARDFTNQRDQYVGLWRYEQNGILFELKIEKRDKMINKIEYQGQVSYNFMDRVILKYKLIKNGTLLYDNLATNPSDDYLSIGSKYGVYNFLSGGFLDTTRNVCGTYSLKIIGTNPDTIFFNLSPGGYYLLNPRSYYEGSDENLFNVPTGGIEMVRVN